MVRSRLVVRGVVVVRVTHLFAVEGLHCNEFKTPCVEWRCTRTPFGQQLTPKAPRNFGFWRTQSENALLETSKSMAKKTIGWQLKCDPKTQNVYAHLCTACNPSACIDFNDIWKIISGSIHNSLNWFNWASSRLWNRVGRFRLLELLPPLVSVYGHACHNDFTLKIIKLANCLIVKVKVVVKKLHEIHNLMNSLIDY